MADGDFRDAGDVKKLRKVVQIEIVTRVHAKTGGLRRRSSLGILRLYRIDIVLTFEGGSVRFSI